jgi:hypothetical protein
MGASTASLQNVNGDGVLRDFNTQKYFIAVKNIDTGEECVHREAVPNLGGWHKRFVDQPIFRNLNLVQDPKFPDLKAPSENTELWTHTYVKKSGANFLVIVTLAFDWISEDMKTDTVIVHAKSPTLPQTCSLYHSMKSSKSRKMCALHYAFAELAKDYGFEVNETGVNVGASVNDWSASIFHSEAAVDNSSWSHFTLTGAFPSNAVEYSAGSVTIPLTLQKLRFLLFSLDNQAPMHYAMVQPHKYGYAFQIPNLSWWRVMATVNFYGEWLGIEKTFQEKKLNLLEPIRIPSAEGLGSQGAFFDVVDLKMLEDTFQKIVKCKENVFTQFARSLDRGPPDVKRLFMNTSGILNITDRSRPTSELEKLTPETWRWHLKYLGLDLMQNSLAQKISWVAHRQDVSKGNAFLASLIDSYTNPGVLSKKEIPPRAFLVDNIEIWFTLCEVFAEAVFNMTGIDTPSDLKNKIVKTRKNFTPVSMTFETLISFCRDLMDSNPKSWLEKFYHALDVKPFPLILSIIDYHAFYAVFFPEKRWGDPGKVWDMVQHAFVYNHRIAQARTHANTVTKEFTTRHTKNVLVQGFAYLLFTFDKYRDLDYWGADPADNPIRARDTEGDAAATVAGPMGGIGEVLHEISKTLKSSASSGGGGGGGRGKQKDTDKKKSKGGKVDGDNAQENSSSDDDDDDNERTSKTGGDGEGHDHGDGDDGVDFGYLEDELKVDGTPQEQAVNKKKEAIRELKSTIAHDSNLKDYDNLDSPVKAAVDELAAAFLGHEKSMKRIREDIRGKNKHIKAAMKYLQGVTTDPAHAEGASGGGGGGGAA